MMKETSLLMSFPPVWWWARLTHTDELRLDTGAIFRKMSWTNRYRIAAANGPLLLTIPIEGGRNQRIPIQAVQIDNKVNWQKQHWRSIFSAYGRAPFFEHYGPELDAIFKTPFLQLADFNAATLVWGIKALRLAVKVSYNEIPGNKDEVLGNKMKVLPSEEDVPGTQYSQVFQDRNGFIPNLSIIDLLMNEGPASRQILS